MRIEESIEGGTTANRECQSNGSVRFVSFKECVVVLSFVIIIVSFPKTPEGKSCELTSQTATTRIRERGEKRETTFVFKILKCQIGPCLNNPYIGPTPGSGEGEGRGGGVGAQGGFSGILSIIHIYFIYSSLYIQYSSYALVFYLYIIHTLIRSTIQISYSYEYI